jgi:hypothetical protein
MTSRRGFLLGIGAALAAPAIVRADSLMKLWVPPKPKLVVEEVYWMSNRMFFVYNGGDQMVHLSMPTKASEWAITLDPGERRMVTL